MVLVHYYLNTSMINVSKILYYSQLGIDIFDINDEFFNDICYSYSENDSDMILKDRVTDIYQNYSLCENNCELYSMNVTQNTVTCKCWVKTYSKAEVEKPNLAQVIRDSFTDSNLGVMKCYKLVFSLKDKLQNYGFLIFSVLVIIHIPLFIHYFKYTLSSVRAYIVKELFKYNYSLNINNPVKKGNIQITNKNKENNNNTGNLKKEILKKKCEI